MKEKIFICTIKDLKDSHYFIKWIDQWKDELIVFIDKSNQISIRSSICPHFGGEIIYDKKKNKLRCMWHNWEFSTETGKCLTFPIKGKLNPYDFEVDPNPLKNYEVVNKKNKIYAIKK